MERVLFDLTYYQRGTAFHGGGEYGNAVLEELLKWECPPDSCGVFFYENKPINRSLMEKLENKRWIFHPIHNVKNVSTIVNGENYTTFYSALPYELPCKNIRFPNDMRYVATFHGMRNAETSLMRKSEMDFFSKKTVQNGGFIYEYENELLEQEVLEYLQELQVHHNRRIIVDSEHTKATIRLFCPEVLDCEMTVLYPPYIHAKATPDKVEEQLFLEKIGVVEKNYGLIISADRWEKNPIRGAIAFDRLFDGNYKEVPKDFKVVVVGGKKQEMDSILCHPDRFLFIPYVSEAELIALYRNAHLFLYPSINEGFGYPPLEAMRHGTICACSVNASIAEVCGEMALYFNPYLINEISSRILQSFNELIIRQKKEIISKQLPVIERRQREDTKKIASIILEGDR